MPLGTGQRNLTKALKQLEGFFWRRITAATQARSQKDDKPYSLKIYAEDWGAWKAFILPTS